MRFDDPEAIQRDGDEWVYPARVIKALSGRVEANVDRARRRSPTSRHPGNDTADEPCNEHSPRR